MSHHVFSTFHFAMHLVGDTDAIASVHHAGEQGDTKDCCDRMFSPYVAGRVGELRYVPHQAQTPLVWRDQVLGECVAWSGRSSLLRSVNCRRGLPSINTTALEFIDRSAADKSAPRPDLCSGLPQRR